MAKFVNYIEKTNKVANLITLIALFFLEATEIFLVSSTQMFQILFSSPPEISNNLKYHTERLNKMYETLYILLQI